MKEDIFKLEHVNNGVYDLIFNMPDEKVNKLSSSIFLELDDILTYLNENNEVKILCFRSGKENNFIAGADINEIAVINSESESLAICNKGLDILAKLENLPFPTIAVINGACLGGGLELALACDYRICTDDPSTVLGLPEVNLGIFPGLGGSQRLPRLIGLQRSLPLILGGKIIKGLQAYKLKITDACFHKEYLNEGIEEFIDVVLTSPKSIIRKRKLKGFMNKFMESTFVGRSLIYRFARKNIMKNSKGFYPAPLAALKVVKKGYRKSLKKGLRFETKEFAKVVPTDVSKNLIRLFFISESLKKDNGLSHEKRLKIQEVNKGVVVGAGVMGSGIAWLFSKNNIDVILKDINYNSIAKGLVTCKGYYNYFLKRRKMKKREVDQKMLKITGQTNYNGFKGSDLVVEAVFENYEVKTKLLAELEQNISDTTVLASNTSSLSINKMSTTLKRPDKFIGMHFFNTPNRMPLVEVIAGKDTSEETIATAVAMVKKLKKTPIVVKDSPGFIVNRVLLPYLNEAMFLVGEGVNPQRIDKVLEKFGMPMGPFTLADLIGLDVAFGVSEIFEAEFGEAAKAAPIIQYLKTDKSLQGKKGGTGFYNYKDKRKETNKSVLTFIKKYTSSNPPVKSKYTDKEIENYLLFRMINESVKCLEEELVASAEYLDMAMIMGAGFPPFRGGILRYADKIGLNIVLTELNKMYKIHGERFKPSSKLILMAGNGEKITKN